MLTALNHGTRICLLPYIYPLLFSLKFVEFPSGIPYVLSRLLCTLYYLTISEYLSVFYILMCVFWVIAFVELEDTQSC